MRTGATELLQQMQIDEVVGPEAGGWWPDLIMATSLLALGDLRAQLPPAMRLIPCVLYMHENQVAYPFRTEHGAGGERDLQYPVTNLMSVLAADRVIWNSRWNLDSFCGGIGEVLSKSRDGSVVDVEQQVRQRSSVIWPPVRDPGAGRRVLHNAPVVVWPHRWEHDKGPGRLLACARDAAEVGLELRWILLGDSRGKWPEAMQVFHEEFASEIVHSGWVESHHEYRDLLHQADWVLSTADHEFFGIAVCEAMLAGCLPWLPDRLSYPEITPDEAHGLSPMNPPDDPDLIRSLCRAHLDVAVCSRSVARIDAAMDSVADGASDVCGQEIRDSGPP